MDTESKQSDPTKPRVEDKSDTNNELPEEQLILEKSETIEPEIKSPENEEPSTSSSSSTSAAPSKVEKGSILELKIVLRYITPFIWRRIQVVNTDTFNDLHNYIQEAMGWGFAHSYMFSAQKKPDNEIVSIIPGYMMYVDGRNASNVQLHEYFSNVKDLVLYEYDLGDSWIHEVFVEKILPPPPLKEKSQYPKCLGGERACPPDDCGGIDGYQHLLEVFKDPSHKEYEELITDWLFDMHPGFNPEKFDHKKVFKKEKIWMRL